MFHTWLSKVKGGKLKKSEPVKDPLIYNALGQEYKEPILNKNTKKKTKKADHNVVVTPEPEVKLPNEVKEDNDG